MAIAGIVLGVVGSLLAAAVSRRCRAVQRRSSATSECLQSAGDDRAAQQQCQGTSTTVGG
jgi:hypothetical protein